MPRVAVVPALVILLVAPAAAYSQSPRTRDSAGVRIVDNSARTTMPVTVKLGAKPTLDVGGLHDNAPDEEFDSKQGYLRGVRLSDGGIAVIDVTKVKYFDAKGKLVKVAGRAGDGPGEFRYLTAICRTRGDTIVVSDRARLGILDKHGNFVRHIASTPKYLPFDGCFGDGTVLMESREVRVPTPTTSTTHLWRVGLDGTTITSIGDFVGMGFDMVTMGEITWAASGTQLFVGDGSRKDIPVFQLSPRAGTGVAAAGEAGQPMSMRMSIRSADPIIPLTDAEAEKRMASTIPNNVSASERSDRMDRMKSMPHASTWPAIGRIYAEPRGGVWVADFQRTYPGPAYYSHFDATGKLVGRLMFPAATKIEDRFEVIGFGVDDILVRRWDDDGATHLTVFPLVPVGGSLP